MKRTLATLAAACLLAAPPAVADDAASLAQRGADLLGQAALALSEASSSSQQVRALTETLRAYETGLAALRDALRQAAVEERALRAHLAPRQEALTDLIVLLQSQTRVTTSLAQAHPGGALPAIRAGMVASDMSPDLGAEVAGLLAELEELKAVVALQQASRDQLRSGAREARTARLALLNAVAERRTPPDPFSTDNAAMQALINSSETLGAFADSLAGSGEQIDAPPERDWDTPVRGVRRIGFRETDAAGVPRPGWVMATRPNALVSAPTAATVRFAGEMPGYGSVAILEPAPGDMLILAGIGEILIERDDIVATGDPIGLMPGAPAAHEQNLIENSDVGGQSLTETLYIELRQEQEPIDPGARFARGTQEG